MMVQGIFRFMQHDHFFRELSRDETEMRDVFRFASPIPVLGRLAEILVLRRYIHSLLSERNTVISEIAESNDWPAYLGVWAPLVELNSCRRRGYC
jgi:hypothetical protein